ncbi:hypothetical protein N7526_011153 [Penicillium atrosanguineum]|nr:hypothetical protein N7526_011153 [Penicillium atrosanguineum]
MGSGKVLTSAAAISTSIPASFALDVDLKTNVALYWGQGYDQQRPAHFCEESDSDIINIGFINVSPSAVGAWPGSNFGNQCDGTVYNGTHLLSGCHQIWEDLPICKQYGKTIMLSVGGDSPNEKLQDDDVATWSPTSCGIHSENSVDGFDLDIENSGSTGWATVVNRLRSNFKQYPDETFYISAAPQCSIPDQQLSDAIANSVFDFIWVQFYNTAGCSASDYFDGGFNFASWIQVIKESANPHTKLFIGLPASKDVERALRIISSPRR